MVKLDEINRTSTFAWSSDSLPLLATGTVAGAVDANFNSSSTLELWDIFSATNKAEPVFSAHVDARFYALAWSKPFEGRSQGLLAGAFEDGTVEFWDVEILIKSKDLNKASVHKSSKHSGPVKSLQFNPNQNHILVTGGSGGQIFVWDTKTFSEPTSPGQAMTPMDEITCVAWNNSVSHIFASTGNGGYTSIWDLKSKREVLHLSYSGLSGRANFSHVAWHPTQSTKLITASDSDTCPLILSWDLRNSNAPEQILEGHKKGVLSLDWCKQDPELLISSGKDNSTLLWNPIKGAKLGEYPTTANWAFQTRFAPSAPDVFATASFDGKVIVQSLQDTSPPVISKVTSTDDKEFWSELSTTETQQPVFETKQAPKWLVPPCGVSFGFGSKLVQLKKDGDGKSVISIEKFVTGKQESSNKLMEAYKNKNFQSIIDSKFESKFINENDKSDWEILKKLSEFGKDKLLNLQISSSMNGQQKESNGTNAESVEESPKLAEDLFFENLGSKSVDGDKYVPQGSFKIFTEDTSDSDKKIIKLTLENKIEDAVDECLTNNKLLEAAILALNASEVTKAKVRDSYFNKNEDEQFSRVLYSVSSKNISDIVANADVSDWREIASSISSFTTDSEDYNNKISELGDRILEHSSSKDKRDEAISCYVAGKALDKIANIWLHELPKFEKELLDAKSKNITSPSDARFEALNNFAEKIATYRFISNITGEFSGLSIEPITQAILEYANLVTGFGQFDLAEKFLQILPSDIAGTEKERINKATGSPTKAEKVGTNATRASIPKMGYSRTGSVTKLAAYSNVPAAAAHSTPIPLPTETSFTPSKPYVTPGLVSGSISTNHVPTNSVSTNPYVKKQATNPYTPKQAINPYKQVAHANSMNTTIQPPPLPPATVDHKQYRNETEGWNDLPDTFKPKASAPRRAAAAASVSSPSPTPLPGNPQPIQVTKRSTSNHAVLPPPPKGTSRSSSRSTVPTQTSTAPSPAQTNSRYAPTAGAPVEPVTPQLNSISPQGLGLSVKNSVMSTPPPPKNPYAPPAAAVTARTSYAAPQPKLNPGLQSPPLVSNVPPPKNPYAPPEISYSPKTNSSGIAPLKVGIPPPPKVGAVSHGGHVQNSNFSTHSAEFPPPPINSAQQQAAPAPVQPEVSKHPEGDRSHIPDSSLPIFQSFSKVLEAIKPVIPEKYHKHAQDMEKRLNFLFDHLNNEDLLSKEAISALLQVSDALEQRDFQTAAALNVDIATKFSDEIGNWHTGVKRLITMAEAMY